MDLSGLSRVSALLSMVFTPREALITSFPAPTVPDKHSDIGLLEFVVFVTEGILKTLVFADKQMVESILAGCRLEQELNHHHRKKHGPWQSVSEK